MNRIILSLILLSTIALFIFSCSKGKETTQPDNKKINLIRSHTWVLDSTNTITPNYNIMQPEVPSSFYNFLTDSMTLNYHNTQLIHYGAFYEAPDKMYFWLPGEIKNPNQYIIIDVITESKLVMKDVYVQTGETRIRYCHAQ